jgi:hypothetical protein
MKDRMTELSKEVPRPNDGNEVSNKTEGLNGENEVSKVHQEDEAKNIEYMNGGNKSSTKTCTL